MELRQLRHFVALADEMNFGQAAKRLNMTQPAVSASIMRLEEDLGIQLFDRDNKRVALTRAGQFCGEARRRLSSRRKCLSWNTNTFDPRSVCLIWA